MIEEKQFQGKLARVNYGEGPPAGPPVVLLHGSTLSWQTFLSSMRLLASSWHVFALDLRGHGRSGRVAGRYRLLDYAADVADFIERAIGQPAVIAGHSLGALVSLPVAADRPDLARGLALLDPPLLYRDTRLLESKWRAAFTRYHALTLLAPDVAAMTALLAEDSPGADPIALQSRARRLARVDPETVSVLLEHRHIEGYDMDALLRRVACPTLLVQCDPAREAALEDDDAEFAQARLRDCVFVRLPGVGHMLHTEQPELLVTLLEKFKQWPGGPAAAK